LEYLPSIENIHEWNWKNIWLLSTGEVGNVGVERNLLTELDSLWCRACDVFYLLSSGSLGNSKTDAENGISTQLPFVWGSIELDQELVNFWLILNIDVLLDESGANDLIDVLDSLCNTLSSPPCLVAIAELDCLVLT
jgi:hypothetical protein